MASQRRTKTKKVSKAELTRKQAIKRMVIFIISLFLIFLTMLRWGMAGIVLYNLTRILVGSLAYIFLILIILVMFSRIKGQTFISLDGKKKWALALAFIGLLLLFQSRFDTLFSSQNLWNILATDFRQMRVSNFAGGGMIGALLYDPAKLLFSKLGVNLIAIIFEIISLYLLVPNLGLIARKYSHKTYEGLKAKFEQLKEGLELQKKKRLEDKEARRLERLSQENSQENKLEEMDIPTDEQENTLDDQVFISEDYDYDQKIDLPNFDPETGEITDDFQVINKPLVKDADEEALDFAASSPKNMSYKLPSIDLLARIPVKNQSNERKIVRDNIKILEETFKSFGINASVESAVVGPSVTKYEIKPATGVRVNKIANLSDDLALALAAKDVRIEAPIPGKSLIGIEVPNGEVATVSFREMWDNGRTNPEKLLELPLGKAVDGSIRTFDLAKMPHLLVAGSTGSGKSVAVNGLITSILMKARPSEVKFLMVDPKMVELSVYNDIPHLLIPVVTDPRKASRALQKVVDEMENRYELFSRFGVRNIEGYNNKVEAFNATSDTKELTLPLIVVIVDELADLMMVASKEVEDAIIRLGQKARAAGIHMILATQRPSVDVISGLIKANVPSRIAFAVSSGTDSRTILDSNGAEKLLGRGDMLFKPIDENHPVRLQGAFLSDDDVERVVTFVKDQEEVEYKEEFDPGEVSDSDSSSQAASSQGDPLFNEAKNLVIETQKASASMIQRRLSTGFNRATRIMDELEEAGIIGPAEGTKPRKVLISKGEISD
ncbi:DNA translocase FtsK [Streptococcaceae bacterium ESL0729]|nr:DNA translocase FtsK [Streptococcaceae bacterium ESL0729]